MLTAIPDKLAGRIIVAGILTVGLILAGPTRAQEESAPADESVLPAVPPSVAALAAALADPDSRGAALRTVAAAASLSGRQSLPGPDDIPELQSELVLGQTWLEALAARVEPIDAHSPVLDTASWRLVLQLEPLGLQASNLTWPLGPDLENHLRQVFDRSNPRLAAASYPVLMWQLEAEATVIWSELLAASGSNPALREALALATWPEPPTQESPEGAEAPEPPAAEETLTLAALSLESMIGELTNPGPPDPRRLGDLRTSLMEAMPALGAGDRLVARNLLRMASLLDGLRDQHYFRFVEGLLASMAELEGWSAIHREQVQWLAGWMTRLLPDISAGYARTFASVDPRLNSALATAFDVGRGLARNVELTDPGQFRRQLADAAAKLGLMIPDMAFYFDLPVRDPIAGGVDACTGIVAALDPDGSPSLTRELFDDCQQTLLDLADDEARETELSGDPDGPFGEAPLQRELDLTSGQRINYGIGYLHDRYNTVCDEPLRALPNPLEWAYLATFMAWLSEQSPVYFQTPENEQRLVAMRDIGNELIRVMAEQVDCIAGTGAGVNDPVMRVLGDYRDQLTELGRGMDRAESEFRGKVLADGADIALEKGAGQSTTYRPGELAIGPCDLETACEMTGELSSTRALLGLFPEEFLVADQSGLGQVEICYDRMEWVDRRSVPVRAGDENVANYHGRLAFDLKGRFLGEGDPIDLFAFRFTSPDEYHYMFAAMSEEVLSDSCPVEWIGSRIVTPLPDRRMGIVPNRLTYLSAPRTLPSRLVMANWDTGSEWRDWFVTGIGVEVLDLTTPRDIKPALEQHLQALYAREQEAIYGSLLQTGTRGEGEGLSPLFDEVTAVTTDKSLLRLQMMLFYPELLTSQDRFRVAMVGQSGLLDTLLVNRFREQNLPVPDILDRAYERLDRFEADWLSLPEVIRRNGTMSLSISQAMLRLNTLYEQYFSAPPEPEEGVIGSPISPTGPPPN